MAQTEVKTKNITQAYTLENLSCAHCAAVMESSISKIRGVEAVGIDFMTKTLRLEVQSSIDTKALQAEIAKMVKGIESEVVVKPYSKPKASRNHEHNHDHDHGHQHGGEGGLKGQIIKLVLSALCFFVAIIADHFGANSYLVLGLFILAFLGAGLEVVWRALKNIARGQIFDENFLMSIATIGAFAIGQYSEGVAVMLFYQLGELFQDYAVGKSRSSITNLMDIRPDYANLKVGDSFKKVEPEQVKIGDLIIVKPGEKIPLDGKVIEGESFVDTSALTGESVPRKAKNGDDVLSGCINQSGLLTIKVSKEFGESTVAKILDLVENATSKKSNSENFISKFARYYTPVVVIIAAVLAIVPPLLISGATFSDWIYRALVFLVISCPCALVISIPLGFFGGIGGASRRGILVKGSNYLEALAQTEIVVFDKTGTLTKGVFKVVEIKPQGVDEKQLLEIAALAESYSNHPISLSLQEAYGKPIDQKRIAKVEEIAGHGIAAEVDGQKVLAGNAKLLQKFSITYPKLDLVGTVVYLAINQQYAGYILIADEVKADSAAAIKGLKAAGISQTVMLTGDNQKVGEAVAKELGLDQVYTQLLPGDKVDKLEVLLGTKSPKGKLAFVGDGINDAPVLARADIGIAMGGLGSDAAIEAADIVIMTDEPAKLVDGIKISKKTLRIVKQNIAFAFGVKLLVLVLGAGGLATMWEAVFADVGVAVLAILNAMRALNVKDLK